MNVLFISSSNTSFGIIPFIKSQELSLKANGVDIDHFTINEKGIKGYFKGFLKLRKILKEKNYQIIHAHYSFCAWVAVLSLPKCPIVVSLMGSDVYGTIHKDGKRNLKSYIEVLIAQLLQPFVKTVIVKSKNLENYIYLKKKVRIIPNGVNFEVFRPVDKNEARLKLNLPLDKKMILFLGNPKDSRKNISLLQKAVALLDRNEVTVVNPYPTKHDQVADYMNSADVFTLMSFSEGSPNVVKEAMACNCPIVATNVGDVEEIIGNTKGCFVTSFDPKQVAKDLENCLKFVGETTGRQDIAHLEINHIAKRIIEVYHEMLKGKGERSF